MSQLLFPTPDEPVAPVASVQDNLEGTQLEATEPINSEDKIMRLIISAAIGLLIGVLEAVIISNSLVEIANAKAFSIVRTARQHLTNLRSFPSFRVLIGFLRPHHASP
jgi:hypothetical protein